jgi:site-specific recombinase XerD
MTKLIYGSGLRLMECVHLRVKDIDFDRSQVIVRDGKGMKDRVTMLPIYIFMVTTQVHFRQDLRDRQDY